jgi:WD repeat-containing protein 91
MAYQYLDDLVKEFLLFRGFTGSLKAFDADIRTEKEKSFRADRWLSHYLY